MKVFVSGNYDLSPRFSESGRKVVLERTADLSAPFALANMADILRILGNARNFGIVLFDAQVHDDFLKELVELSEGRVVIVGLREFASEQELVFIRQSGIRVYPASLLLREGIDAVCDGLMEIASSWPSCHVIVSLDVLDPAFARVSPPSPGGFTTRELLYFVQRLRLLKNFAGAGIVDFEQELRLSEKLLAEFADRKLL